MDHNDIELQLLMNHPICIDGVGYISSPKISQVISLGYSIYNQALSCLLFNKNNNETTKKLDKPNFHVLCLLYLSDEIFKEMFQLGVRLIFHDEISFEEINNEPTLRLQSGGSFNSNNFSQIQKLVKLANKVKVEDDEEEYRPANSRARELIETIKRNREKRPKTKEMKNLHSLISGIAWKHNGINIYNIFDLTIYQLYDGYYRIENIDHYNNILTGIYTGNIESKNIKMSEIDWAKII